MMEINEAIESLNETAVGTCSVPGWMEQLKRRYKGQDRPCCHVVTRRIDGPKLCPFNYECEHCPFDQMLDDMDWARLGA